MSSVLLYLILKCNGICYDFFIFHKVYSKKFVNKYSDKKVWIYLYFAVT